MLCTLDYTEIKFLPKYTDCIVAQTWLCHREIKQME